MKRQVDFHQGLSPSTRVWLQNMNQAPMQQQVNPMPHRVQIHSNCICERPKKKLFCRRCGFQLKGRIRKLCSSHPNTIFLMDLDHCPGCRYPSSVINEYSDNESEA